MQFITFRVILKRIGAVYYMLKDKTVPLRKKALIVFGIIYLFLPVDIIPPILFPFGFIDDIILWTFIILHLKDELDTYWMGEKNEDLSRKFKHKTFVEDVDYDVDEDNNNKDDDKE